MFAYDGQRVTYHRSESFFASRVASADALKSGGQPRADGVHSSGTGDSDNRSNQAALDSRGPFFVLATLAKQMKHDPIPLLTPSKN